jgi:hypothetical protein
MSTDDLETRRGLVSMFCAGYRVTDGCGQDCHIYPVCLTMGDEDGWEQATKGTVEDAYDKIKAYGGSRGGDG